MKRSCRYMMILSTIFFALTLGGVGWSQELTKVRLVHVAFSSNQAPAWVAREAGFFQKQGLDVEIIRIGGSSKVVQVMVAGEVGLAHVGASAAVEAATAGADVAIVAATVKRPQFRLMANPAIKSIAELKGRKVGVTRFGSSTDFLVRWGLVNKWGLTPDRDVPLIQVGGIPELLMAARAGAIDAAPLSTPDDMRVEDIGWKELADFSTLGLDYMTGTLASTRKYIRSNEDVLRRFMKAFVQGIHIMRTDKEFTRKSLERFMRLKDERILEAIYNQEILKGLEKVPVPSLAGVQTILDELSGKRPAIKGRKPEEFVDARFVKELQESGYIDALYRGGSSR